MTANKGSVRVLHVLNSNMGAGGIETWLMHVLRHIDRERFRIDFLLNPVVAPRQADEIRALGASILSGSNPRRPIAYARTFRRILRQHGPYDIVHSHPYPYTGYILRLARQSGVPIRIAHCHADFSRVEERVSSLRRVYLTAMKSWVAQNATLGLAPSREAANTLFGSSWEADPRWRILYYGIDLEPFRATVRPASVRTELGIPTDALVVGHVGRFDEQKNHPFLVDVAVQIAVREPNMRLLLVGDGPLRPAIERQIARAGIADKVIFAGVRTDVPRLMLGAMDVFVLPSLFEGLPLVGIEAKAAGLVSILSDAITKEVGVVDPLIRRLSLSQPAPIWAETILATRSAALPITQQEALGLIRESKFSIASSVRELEEVYAN
jgi:glycosyltransferase involved in cell wall biosynthesis